MKKILTFILIFNCLSLASAQAQITENTHYLFKSFTKGNVLFKTGATEEYILNFNRLTEQIIFERNGIYLEIVNRDAIDTIYIQKMKFVPVDKVFYEAPLTFPVPFYVEHKCTLIPPGKPAGYGGTSQTGAVVSITTLTNTGKINQLKLPDEYAVSSFIKYWIKKDNILCNANSIKQIAKLFPEKEDAIKQFKKKNKTDFKKQEDVEKLILAL